jgi:hypothetical protein
MASVKPRAFVVGAFGAAGGAYMNYRVAKILSQQFELAVFIVQLHGETPLTSYFEYDQDYPSIALDELSAVIERHDILLMSPSNSHLWLGSRLPCRKLMYVQGFNTFSTLDVGFDAYVTVSSFCQKFVELVYGISAPIIPAYLPNSSVPSKCWSERNSARVLVNMKGDPALSQLTLEAITQRIHERVGPVIFEDLRSEGPLQRERLQERLADARYLLTLSPAEGFGLIPLEAMRHGVAVTGYHAMGGTEYMLPHENSACVQYGEIDAVADILVRFMREPDWAQALGKAGVETAKRYSEDAFVENWTRYLHGFLRA